MVFSGVQFSRLSAVDTRFIFSAMMGVFCVVLIFAAVTTARHISDRAEPTISRSN
jgi:hypothetical protein